MEKNIGANKLRIINIFFPGFDGSPENDRGDYAATMSDFSVLVNRLLKFLGIRRAIFLIHSMGGYFINYYAQIHSDYIAGLIYMAAPSISWYIGYMTFYSTICGLMKFNKYIGKIRKNKIIKLFKVSRTTF